MKKILVKGFSIILVVIVLLSNIFISSIAAGIKTIKVDEKWSESWTPSTQENQFLFECTETGFYDVVFEDNNRTAALWIYVDSVTNENSYAEELSKSCLEGRINFKVHNENAYTVQQVPFVKGKTYEISLRYLVIPENYYEYSTVFSPNYYSPDECGEYKNADVCVTFKKSEKETNKITSQQSYFELKNNSVNWLEFSTVKAGDYQLKSDLVKSDDAFHCGGALCDAATLNKVEQFSIESGNKVFYGLEANKKYYILLALTGNQSKYSKISIDNINNTAVESEKSENSSASECKHVLGNWRTVVEAKCDSKGTETRKCSKCSHTEARDIAATGHTLGGWKTTKEAACEAKGEQTRACAKCDYKETKAIDALGHKFSNPTVTKAPTCTETGIETGKCTRCNKETTNTIKATGHKIEKYIVTLEPTCTEKGKSEGTCITCGVKAEKAVAAKGHSYGKAVITKEATETEEGLKTETCTTCGDVKESVIPVISVESNIASDKADDTMSDGDKGDTKNDFPWIVVVIVAAVAVAAVVTIVVVKKKKANS